MKFVRALIFAGFVVSMGLNILLYKKNEKSRQQFRVNNNAFSKKDYHDWMEMHYGILTQAQMIQYYLVTDAATKAGVMPSEEEVKRLISEQEESNPQIAVEIIKHPWTRTDVEQRIRQQLALFNLATKDVKVSDDQLKSFYESMGSTRYDEPAKLYARIIVCGDTDPVQRLEYLKRAKSLLDQIAERAKLEQPATGVQQKVLADIDLVKQQLQPHIGLPFVDGRQVFRSTDPPNSVYHQLNGINVGQSAIIAYSPKQPVLAYVEKRVERRKTTLADPMTHKIVEREFKSTQQVNVKEMMRKLWDAADIQTDPEGAKSEIERLIVPDRAIQKQKETAGA